MFYLSAMIAIFGAALSGCTPRQGNATTTPPGEPFSVIWTATAENTATAILPLPTEGVCSYRPETLVLLPYRGDAAGCPGNAISAGDVINVNSLNPVLNGDQIMLAMGLQGCDVDDLKLISTGVPYLDISYTTPEGEDQAGKLQYNLALGKLTPDQVLAESGARFTAFFPAELGNTIIHLPGGDQITMLVDNILGPVGNLAYGNYGGDGFIIFEDTNYPGTYYLNIVGHSIDNPCEVQSVDNILSDYTLLSWLPPALDGHDDALVCTTNYLWAKTEPWEALLWLEAGVEDVPVINADERAQINTIFELLFSSVSSGDGTPGVDGDTCPVERQIPNDGCCPIGTVYHELFGCYDEGPD